MKLLVKAIVNSQSDSAVRFNQSSSPYCVESCKIGDAIESLRKNAVESVEDLPVDLSYLVTEVRTFED